MRTPRIIMGILASVSLVAAVSAGSGAASASPVAVKTAATVQSDERDPVILAGGAFMDESSNSLLATRLRGAGFDVYFYKIPTPTASLWTTAPSLASFVDEVLAKTGGDKVDVVNHSQSGLLTRHVIKYLGGADDIDTVVSMSGLHQGSRLGNMAQLIGQGDCAGIVICQQLAEGSTYLTNLNNPAQAIGSIHYVNIGSRADVLAIPTANNFMTGPGDITNVIVQDQCWWRMPGHISMISDGAVASGVIQGLLKRPVRLNCWAV